ncbi:MAG TPA: PilZ domain-containing protein [Thermoanaerobaculia bacterium]|nr:PilZ domain-containing protein [Thermoanaerobaculia bacterium]
MALDVVDLRKGDRFLFTEAVSGSFGGNEVTVLNVSLGGAQFTHPQPMRIGTRGRLTFRRGDVIVAVPAHVVWSHLGKVGTAMSYTSGVKLDAADPQFAAAINALYKSGIVLRDAESLDRKRQRMIEREAARKSQVRVIPSSEPPPG